MKTIAVMQPYIFPYVGYYQLATKVDEFVFFDDVNFIKKGFIHRNNILLNGEKFSFSIPVSKVSQNRKINEHFYRGEFDSFLKQIRRTYAKAPFFDEAIKIIESCLFQGELGVAQVNISSISAIFDYVDLPFDYSSASTLKIDGKYHAQDRIIKICKELGATHYVNAVGGKELYDNNSFAQEGIKLSFIQPYLTEYKQISKDFVSGLSIIDALMYCTKSELVELIQGGSFEGN